MKRRGEDQPAAAPGGTASPRAMRVWEALADEQIQNAYAAGAFENLPGFGRPLADLDEPHDEWQWVKQKLRREEISLLPASLEILRDVEQTLARLSSLTSERAVREEIAALNERIRVAHFRSVQGPASTQMPLDVEEVVLQWRKRCGSGR